MPHFLEYTPEALNLYRTSVTDRLKEALAALESFSEKETGSFFRDSKQANAHTTLTTPARTYMAFASASRHIPVAPEKKESWIDQYLVYANNPPVSTGSDGTLSNSKTGKLLNNFEIAKLSDLFIVERFIRQFHKKEMHSTLGDLRDKIARQIKLVIDNLKKAYEGEICIDNDDRETRHFFVTLHLLRAAHAYDVQLNRKSLSSLVEAAKNYCIEQCYYASRNAQHKADAARLTFAGVIYCQYEDDVDPDLVLAICQALLAFQHQSGSWPPIHPIPRKDNPTNPWYIATHDIALCLPWFYFQPRVPEAARLIILQMMEAYFLRWVIPSFRQCRGETLERTFSGWSDDRATGGDMVVGWASAVVCHFLANYLDVLDDVINRRVIETLALEPYAHNFLVQEGQPASNPRFNTRDLNGRLPPVWIDLPPHAWPRRAVDEAVLRNRIVSDWTDPTEGNKIAGAIATEVIKPIYNVSNSVVGQKSVGILGGPPGTRKTSLVRTVAGVLEWPLILVPASAFFDQGFDMMDKRASEVFRKLNYLTYCVIFFDEFEEFFKDRGTGSEALSTPSRDVDSRTIAAFTTSAMLPRLQDLHDQKKCIVFLATNHLEKIDAAIIRPGRFDYSVVVNHPKVARFTNDQSYFENPGSTTLGRLKIGFDRERMRVETDDKARLSQISAAVKMALMSKNVQNELTKFNETYAKELVAASSSPAASKSEELYVWFKFVEAALAAVSEKLETALKELKTAPKKSDIKKIDASLRAAAESKLIADIGYQLKQAGGRGPAPLNGL